MPGVSVRTVCDDPLWEQSAISDEEGRFSEESIGCISDDCRLEVSAPEPVRVLRVEDHCDDSSLVCGTDCSTLIVNVVLAEH